MRQRMAIAMGLTLAMLLGVGLVGGAAMAQSARTGHDIDQSLFHLDIAQQQFEQGQREDQRDEDLRQREFRTEEQAEVPEAQLPTPDLWHSEPSLFNDHKDVRHDSDDLHRGMY